MKKIKQILAIAAIAVIVICIILTLVFAILTYTGVGDFSAAWKASLWSMVFIPCIIYVMLMFCKMADKKDDNE